MIRLLSGSIAQARRTFGRPERKGDMNPAKQKNPVNVIKKHNFFTLHNQAKSGVGVGRL
jgi:hypothetical protein